MKTVKGEELIRVIIREYEAQRKADIEDFCFEWFLEGYLKGKIVLDEKELRELQKKAESLGYDNDSLILLDEILGYDRTGENLARVRNQ